MELATPIPQISQLQNPASHEQVFRKQFCKPIFKHNFSLYYLFQQNVLWKCSAKSRSMGVLSTMAQCSAQTTSKRLEAQIMLKLVKKTKTSMGAPKGKKVCNKLSFLQTHQVLKQK